MPIPNIDIHKKTGACYYLPSNTLLSEVFYIGLRLRKIITVLHMKYLNKKYHCKSVISDNSNEVVHSRDKRT